MDVLSSSPLMRPIAGMIALRRWAVASLVVNIVIVVTGALVRLTDSGLGCPTWPRCTESSYVTHPELGYHGAIEFGNRLLTFVLVIVAVGTWLAAMLHREHGRPRMDLLRLTTILALGIPAQAVIGGITVLTQLNPYVVALHLLVSFVLIALSVALVRRTRGLSPRLVSSRAAVLARAAFVLMWAAVWLGTVVTGSGPHAGDENAARNGLNSDLVAHLHALAVYATVAATLGCVLLLRTRAAYGLLALEVAQAVIGFLQYYNGLPVWLVTLHLLGAALAIALATNLLLSVRSLRSDALEQPLTSRGAVPAATTAERHRLPDHAP
ncbi:MAG TPA: COX15/CtaA family protein [Propionibacteriaceae bacterium]|nr:COX15/CtaA family protein [Propionibacteriaceae bacterium]